MALHFPSEPRGAPQAMQPAAEAPRLLSAPPPAVAPPPPGMGGGSSLPAGKPNLLVRSMFGLRAFGRNKKPSASPSEDAGAPSFLGLKSRRHSEAGLSAIQPPLLSNDPSGLPRLPNAPADMPRAPLPRAEVGRVLDRIGASKQPSRSRSSRASARPRGGSRPHGRGAQGTGTGWIAFGAATVGVGVLVMVGVLLFGRRPAPETSRTLELASGAPAQASASVAADVEMPRSKLSSPGEQLRSLMVQIRGRKLSPELRAYIDEDAASVAKALTTDCKEGQTSEVCSKLTETFVDQKPLQIKKRPRDPGRPRAGWLRGLKLPRIPVEDDERVKRQFEFYTENPVGRETFQAMLFRCGAYKDLIQSELVKYELPTDIMAVVFAESSCFIHAESPAGALGLWQFTPASARAYHLRVKDGVVDERLSPVKATQAGVHYLADMYALFGEWDLVFASYNMGPFALMARLERAGGDVGFWDLVDAQLLPEETENYAPAIQALALVMNNLSRLRFSTSQMRAPQLTADLEAPAGARLSMVARAAAMSTAELRKLNPDIVGHNVPNLPGGFSVQVPKDVVWQARDTLKELLAQSDDADQCVSPAFDWGKQQFTKSMAEACSRKLKARDSAIADSAAVASPAEASTRAATGPSTPEPSEQ